PPVGGGHGPGSSSVARTRGGRFLPDPVRRWPDPGFGWRRRNDPLLARGDGQAPVPAYRTPPRRLCLGPVSRRQDLGVGRQGRNAHPLATCPTVLSGHNYLVRKGNT